MSILARSAAFLALAFLTSGGAAHAASIIVSTFVDEIDSASPMSLREAITTATDGSVIEFDAQLFAIPQQLNLVLGTIIIDKQITIAGPGSQSLSISGQSLKRIFTIDGGALTLNNVTLKEGLSIGGNGGDGLGGGGGGAGLGGAIAVLVGSAQCESVVFANNQAMGGIGGDRLDVDQGGGGGGIDEADGGMGDDTNPGSGGGALGGGPSANGGFGSGGGGSLFAGEGGLGGFGGGGGGASVASLAAGAGGFGGGGGGGTTGAPGGAGGSFGGAGGSTNATPGAGGGGGAGLGGAVFVNDGATFACGNCMFLDNSADGGAGGSGPSSGAAGQGKGGAVFNHPGGTVNLMGVRVEGNSASNAGSSQDDNAHLYNVSTTGLSAAIVVNSLLDEPDALTGDLLPESSNGNVTLRAALEETNATGWSASISFEADLFSGGPGTITLDPVLGSLRIAGTRVFLFGPGKDLLAISGDNQVRLLFLDDADLALGDITLRDGTARGGSGGSGDGGGGGGAGLGGAIAMFNDSRFDGTNVAFSENTAAGGGGGAGNSAASRGGGGGGMDDAAGASGLSGNGNGGGPLGGAGGTGGAGGFASGGGGGEFNNGGSGGYGGGGGGAGPGVGFTSGGTGGFGGGGGGAGQIAGGFSQPGSGGEFAGGGGDTLFSSGGGGGAGLGGAIFCDSGTVTCFTCEFNDNRALQGTGGAPSGAKGQGKGGNLFLRPPSTATLYDPILGDAEAEDYSGTAFDNAYSYGDVTYVLDNATFVIDTVSDTPDAIPGDSFARDSNGFTSLRSVFEETNAIAATATVTFAPSLFTNGPATFLLGSALGLFSGSLTITGPGADQAIIDAQSLDRLIVLGAGAGLTLEGLTLMRGAQPANNNGGGMHIAGTLEMIACVMRECTTELNGGAMVLEGNPNVKLLNCLFTENTAATYAGALLVRGGSIELANCTFSNNKAGLDGGAILTDLGNNTTLTHCTITNNYGHFNNGSAGENTGGIHSFGGNIRLYNTVIAGNFSVAPDAEFVASRPDVSGTFIGDGNNIVGVIGSASGFGPSDNDYSGSIEDLLLPLADNGGPTDTHLPAPISPLINAGSASLSNYNGQPLTTDQRGPAFPRREGAQVDIGAVELTSETTRPSVTVEQALTQLDPVNTLPIVFDITFDEPMPDFPAGAVSVLGGALVTSTSISRTSPNTFTLYIVAADTDGDIQVSIPENSVADPFGNLNTPSTSTDNSVVLDRQAPAPFLTTNAPSNTTETPIPFTVDFGEAVGFGEGGITVNNGVVTGFSGGPAAYTFGINPAIDGAVTVSIAAGAAQDTAGNLSTFSGEVTVTYQTPFEGVVDGAEDGANEGEGDGTTDGEGDGTTDGEGDGIADGEGDGIADGEGDGIADGEGDGIADGEGDGEASPIEGEGEASAEGEPPVCEGEPEAECTFTHSADINGDGIVNLGEVLRVVQLYNAGEFHCQQGSEDGYAIGPGDTITCTAHASDYIAEDFVISLSELLRLVQLYTIGGYYECGTTEDGFCI